MVFTHLCSYLMNIFHWICITFPKNDGGLYVYMVIYMFIWLLICLYDYLLVLYFLPQDRKISVLHITQFRHCFNYPCTFPALVFIYELNILSCRLKRHWFGSVMLWKVFFHFNKKFPLFGLMYCMRSKPAVQSDQRSI